jgi:predicted enzyme related to lactoylglutathione lyase
MTHGPDGTGRGQVGRWGWLQVDCADPVGLATFWAAVLGGEVALADASGDPPQYLGIRPMPAGGPELSFQRVPEPKTTKNRLHLDVAVDDVEEAAARVVALGASRVSDDVLEEYGFRFVVMADPEGNEFCLVSVN